jgi:RNA polymerase sigma factor (sigma-70 family)
MMSNVTAAEALRRSRQEPALFADFYRHHVRSLVAYFARRVYDAEAAMDLAAETFAQAYLGRRRFRGHTEEEAAAWLYRIANRQLSRFYRKSYVERRALNRLGIDPPRLDAEEQERIEELSETEGLRAALRSELIRLSTPQRDAVRLRVVEELPYPEVAHRLAISEQAARARVMRGLKALAAGLQQHSVKEETHA